MSGLAIAAIALTLVWQLMCGADELQGVYAEVTNDLISIRKEYPTVQPKIYKLLDQVDKLFKQTKAVHAERDELRKKLQERQVEAKEQVESAKRALELAKNDLTKKFEEQQRKLQGLELERDKLVAKVTTLEAGKARSMLAKKSDVAKEGDEAKA